MMVNEPKQYRKKPVVIEAIQFTGENLVEVTRFMGGDPPEPRTNDIATDRWEDYERIVKAEGLTVRTLEDGVDGRAKHVASVGDWIIKGVQGEFYPCKPDIFNATYDPA